MTPSVGNPTDAAAAAYNIISGTNIINNNNNANDNLVATAAVDLIRQLDHALGEMNASACAGAAEVEEARKNARVASELARRFSSPSSSLQRGSGDNGLHHYHQHSVTPTTEHLNHNNDEGYRWNQQHEEKTTTPTANQQQQKATPPPPPPSAAALAFYQNGSVGTPFLRTSSPQQPQQRRPTADDSHHYSSSSSSNNSNSKRIGRTTTTAEQRLAAAHAEDLLQVSLELERTKQQLEAEQMRHDETKSSGQQARSKTVQLEAQLERLLQDMETAREESGRKMDELLDDVQRAEHRIQTAEYEANTAMEICLQADEAKEEIDRLLKRALAEVNLLKGHIAQHHSAEDYLQNYYHDGSPDDNDSSERSSRQRRVHFQDDEMIAAPPSFLKASPETLAAASSRPSRALVAAGRQLLHRTFSTDADDDAPFVSRHSTEASAERRQRLRNRLKSLGVDDNDDSSAMDFVAQTNASNAASAAKSNRARRRNDLGSAVEALDICRNSAQIIKESGRRLGLTGRWFNLSDGKKTTAAAAVSSSTVTDEIHLETLAKHYTTLVEVRCRCIIDGTE